MAKVEKKKEKEKEDLAKNTANTATLLFVVGALVSSVMATMGKLWGYRKGPNVTGSKNLCFGFFFLTFLAYFPNISLN